MDPSRRYPLWYKNVVSLWILFGMAWLALIIKLVLSLLEAPGATCSCKRRCSKGHLKPRSWKQGPGEGPQARSPQPGRHTKGPVAQVVHCGEDS